MPKRSAETRPDHCRRAGLAPLLLAVLLVAGLAPPSGARAARSSGDSLVVWVRLRDRGPETRLSREAALARARDALSPRALARRERAAAPGTPLVGVDDLPLYQPYLRALAKAGARLRARSRWMNAVSVRAAPGTLEAIASLSFVAGLQRVERRFLPEAEVDPALVRPARPAGRGESAPGRGAEIDYGDSRDQLLQLQVPTLHAQGLTGQGVRIAVLDSGFNTTHPVFAGMDIVGQYDFIHDDPVTAYQPGQDISTSQDHHGTAVLSTIGGYAPGELVGPAFGAEFLLAKTEEISFERTVEEDWWVEGIEWAEAHGADIVTSSVGYTVFEDDPGYVFADLDGNTAVTTRAADHAAALGVFVATAVGNGGAGPYPYPITPSDGDSVAAIGAVTLAGTRAAFSSVGPTADGRIKPDLAALGVGAITAAFSGETPVYVPQNGTSFATPLVSGLAALLMESEPRWMGQGAALIERLRETATQHDSPDNELGYGIPQGVEALGPPPGPPPVVVPALDLAVVPQPARGQACFRYRVPEDLPAGTPLTIDIADVTGRFVRRLGRVTTTAPEVGTWIWDGRDESGGNVAPGIYFLRLRGGDATVRKRVLLLR